MSCVLALMLNTSRTVVFILVMGFYNPEGVWTEKVIDRKPFLEWWTCNSHIKYELPKMSCQASGRNSGCLKGEYYWCVQMPFSSDSE